MLEAMATGLAVLATIHGGIPEAVENDRSGILIAERDHQALAKKLLELVQSGDRLSELAQRGAESIAEKFNDKKQTRLLEDFYFEAMTEGA
jgi:colanic acid/amylovoran biosynthesis glycosyltransferase